MEKQIKILSIENRDDGLWIRFDSKVRRNYTETSTRKLDAGGIATDEWMLDTNELNTAWNRLVDILSKFVYADIEKKSIFTRTIDKSSRAIPNE